MVLGTAEVEVEADTRNFWRKFQEEARSQPAVKVKVTLDKKSLSDSLKSVDAEVEVRAATARMVREIEDALRRVRVPDLVIPVTADIDRAQAQLRGLTVPDLTAQVASDAEIEVRAATDRMIGDIEAALRRVTVPDLVIPVTADTSRAEAQLRSLTPPDLTVPVRMDADDALRQLRDDIDAITGTITIRTGGGGGGGDGDPGGAGRRGGAGMLAGMTAALRSAGPAALAAVGALYAAALVSAFNAGFQGLLEEQQIAGMLQAQLGVTADEAHQAGVVAGDLYARGITDSVDEGAQAVQAAIRAGLAAPDDIPGLTEISTQIADVARLMEEDIGQTSRAVGQMVRTGLVDNATEGLDLLTRGVQGGANAAEDLLDTFSEYSTQFRQLGLTGEEALGLIQQGLAGGARDADVVADALKEFSIEAAQGGERVVDTFDDLGLNADRLSEAFAAGGPAARAALEEVFDTLQAIEDPLERNQLAIGLFGTKAEDLGEAWNHLDLDSAAGELDNVAGAADRAGDALRDNMGTRLQRVGREFRQAMTGLFTGDFSQFGDLRDAVEDVLPDLRDVGVRLVANIEAGLEAALPRIPGIVYRIGERIGDSIGDWGPIVLKALGFLVALPTLLAGLVLTGLAGAFASIGRQLLPYLQTAWQAVSDFFTQTIPAFFSGLGGVISSAFGAAWQATADFLTETVPEMFAGLLQWFLDLPALIAMGLGALAGLLVLAFATAIEAVVTFLVDDAGPAVGQFFVDLPGRAADALAALGSMLWAAMGAGFDYVTERIPAAIDAILQFLRDFPGQAVSALGDLGSRLGDVMSSALDTAGDWVEGGLADIVGFFEGLPGQIESALSGFGTAIWDGLRGMINEGIRIVNSAVEGFNRFSPIDAPTIPELANGAIVYGDTIARIGEAGPEVVIPLTRPARAAQLAQQSGLIDLLIQRGALQAPQQTTQHHTWNVHSPAADSRVVAAQVHRTFVTAGV